MAFQNITGNVLIPATAVTGAFVTLYTTPASVRTFLKCIDICNTTGGALTVFVSIVASGGTAGTANALYSGISVSANGVLQWRGLQILPAGTFISVKSTTTGLTITASGGEAT